MSIITKLKKIILIIKIVKQFFLILYNIIDIPMIFILLSFKLKFENIPRYYVIIKYVFTRIIDKIKLYS